MNTTYQKAVEYNAHGYSVIPVSLDSKKPTLRSWKEYQERSANDDEIGLWFSKKINIGIITGKISGITVVDIDTKEEGNITPLEAFPETYTVRTPSGGYHLYYQYNSEIKQTANTFPQFPHVDIRNDGGYVVAPPSEFPNGKYEIIKNMPFSVFPISLFTPPLSKQKISGLLRGLNKMAEGDGRNNTLTKITGKVLNIVQFVDHELVAYPIILAANKQFKEPLSEKEVRAIYNSIHGKESKKPLVGVELLRNDKGVIPNEENVYRTIYNDSLVQGSIRYNIFTGFIESKFNRKNWDTFQRVDIIHIRTYLMSTYPHFSKIPHASVEDAVIKYAEENRVSPPVEYLKNLVWDKTPRLDQWLMHTYGTPDDIYHQKVASNWMKGLVKRIVDPGSKFDYVLVIEGKQGLKKSTSLAVLGGAWHVETVFTPDNKDFFMLFGGKAIVEFSEGETLSRTEAKRLKAIITMQFDKYRPPYDKAPKEFPRQCVFAMTTNQGQYLKDETGNRRWLPVECLKVADIEWLKNNRDQLYAETYHRVITLNETTYEFPEEETLAQQAMRQISDPREEQVYDWYFCLTDLQQEEGITTREAFTGAVNKGLTTFGAKEMTKIDEMIFGSMLREYLHLDRVRIMDKGERFYRYYPTKQSKAMAPKPGVSATSSQLLKTAQLDF